MIHTEALLSFCALGRCRWRSHVTRGWPEFLSESQSRICSRNRHHGIQSWNRDESLFSYCDLFLLQSFQGFSRPNTTDRLTQCLRLQGMLGVVFSPCIGAFYDISLTSAENHDKNVRLTSTIVFQKDSRII